MSAIKDKLAKGMQKSKDAVTGTPAIKVKIREATSNKSWGPTGQQLQELARCSFHYSSFGIIMAKIWKRLNDHGKNWRHIYKALLVLDYLIKNGSKQVIVDARQHLPNIQTLTTYQHIDSSDNDVGQSVRERSRAIIELLNDPERLAEEREKAKHNRGKYSDSMGSEAGRRATRSRDEDGGFNGDDFESKGDDYRGGRGASPSYAKRGVNSPRPGRKDSDDDDIPKPEPLPQEWLSESQENMGITYNNDKEAKPHKSPVPRSKPRKAQATPGQTPPDLRDKAEQLKEMFVGLSTEDAMKILRKCEYSISDAALRLSDPHRMNKYTGQRQQQQQQQQQAKEQRKPRAPTLESTNAAPGGSLLTDPVVGMQNLSIGGQGSGSFTPAFYGGVGVSQAQQPYPYPQPQQQQQQSPFATQPAAAAGSPYAVARQPQQQLLQQQPSQGSFFAQPQAQSQSQPPLSGSFSPAGLGSGPSASQAQSWTSFGAAAAGGLYGSSSLATVGSSNASIAAAPLQQQQPQQAAYFAQQQQQLQQQQMQLQQQQQQLQLQIQQQQQLLQKQQAMQPPLSSGGGAFPALQYAQQGMVPQPQAAFTTPQPYGSSSSAATFTTPGSPLQYPHSPQLPYQQGLASQPSPLAQTWSGQQAPLSGGFSGFGQAAPQSSSFGAAAPGGLYGSSSFHPSQLQQQPQQQQQQQTNTDVFASLVAQQLPKGAQLQSLSPPTQPQQPEAKKTLAQLQSHPAYFPAAGQQLPPAPQHQVGNGQNPFGQQSFF